MRLESDQTLAAEAWRGSWKFEASDPYDLSTYKGSTTVLPGEGVGDLDRLRFWMEAHPRCLVELATVDDGRREVTVADVARFRELFVQKYGEVDRPNEYLEA